MAFETSCRSILLTMSKLLSGIESKETALFLDCQATGSDAAFSHHCCYCSPEPVPMRVTEEALCEQERCELEARCRLISKTNKVGRGLAPSQLAPSTLPAGDAASRVSTRIRRDPETGSVLASRT